VAARIAEKACTLVPITRPRFDLADTVLSRSLRLLAVRRAPAREA